MNKRARILCVWMVVFVSFTGYAIAQAPVLISPGENDGYSIVFSGCPTFSWSEVTDAASYRVVVFALDEFAATWNSARTLIVEGPPSQAIEEAARRRGADLVTVSSRGAGASSMVLLGGTAEEIMSASPCDVAVARTEGTFRRP